MKKAHLITISVFCCLIALPLGLFVKAPVNAQSPAPDASYRLSGPYNHKNLTVFLVHGKDQTSRTFLTLQEALAQKKVRVYETKEVNELVIKNFSNENIYVQAGDIVRGGEQDRMISIDFIVPPKSGRMPIEAFCVESGRWNKRGNEEAAVFSSSENGVVSKEIKLAAKSAKSQEEVWQTVKVAQDKLGRNVGGSVQDRTSTSSLELSVESPIVKATTAAYLKSLSGILQNKSDVIGYVFAINGKVNSADIYASHALFAKLWPKLIKSSAVEAVAEIQNGLEHKPVTGESVEAFLAESEQASASTKDVTAHVRLVTREDDKNAFYETQDRTQKDGFVHRNYIRKQ
jgi:ARG/rhodanese/phosphatase superfamily protein